MNQPRSERLLFFLVLITGILLRFHNYADWSLSNDELSAMSRLQYDSFSTMIREGVMLSDMHPPGVQVFLWLWTHIFGTAQALYRLPFVIAGCLSILLFYKIGEKWFGYLTALISTAFFSSLSFLVLYSQLARPYSFGVFFALLFVYSWTLILINRNPEQKTGITEKIMFVFSGTACMYTHYFCFLFAGLVGLSGLLFIKNRKQFISYISMGIAMFVLYIPAFPVAYYQFSIGGLGGPEGWLGKPGPHAVREFFFYALNESRMMAVLLLAVFISSLRTRLTAEQNKLRILALVWCMLPVLIAYYYSLYVNPVYQYSILIFGFPFLLLFACAGFNFPGKYVLTGSVCFVLLAGVFSMTVKQQFYTKAQFAVFREIAERTAEISRKYGADNVERTISVIFPFYIHYYLDKAAPGMKYSLYKVTSPDELRSLDSLVTVSQKPYFIHAWSNNWHAPETEQIIRNKYPYLIERDSLFNAGFLVYAKEAEAKFFPHFTLDTINDFESVLWNNDAAQRTDSMAYQGRYSIHMKPTDEYSSGIRMNAMQAGIHKGSIIEMEVMISSSTLNKESLLVLSIENADGNKVWRSRNLTDFIIPGRGWKKMYFSYEVTEDISPAESLVVYMWNNGKSDFYADNFRISVR